MCVAFSSNGLRIGDVNFSNFNGRLVVYNKAPQKYVWTQLGNNMTNAGSGREFFGHSIAINGPGTRVIGGAPAKQASVEYQVTLRFILKELFGMKYNQ